MHFERLSDELSGDGLVDEMLRLRGAVRRPAASQVCWYHPGLWPGLSPEPDRSPPQFVPGCVAYRSVLRPDTSRDGT
ncbi:MAG: hypothetical protein FWH11_08655 [Micrococcales bacterium]|nr:hypothetical protein [Micrococcales bacterium]